MIDMAVPTFRAENVKPLRQALGLTQHELAEQLGVSQSLVAQWERGAMIPRGPAAILLAQLKSRADLEKESVPA